jgi:hypothetical protein
MKPRMMSKPAMDQLFHHILGGHASSHQGIVNLEQQGLVPEHEIKDLLKRNNERLIDRINEFKIIHKLTCIFFALMFGYMQISCEDLDMRRSSRTRVRTSRVRSARKGKRRNEGEVVAL